ncbi:hypothetical protein H257_08269 [Aphanomyces astaci]|uniref:Uncharacterized protein n=1 Tax=Aphanomyces astaci TaxID=112090 RepID=W4GFP1_APHAT|nr:hypothetical protein H257_08269 [Aphanomyces astaci]ETV78056.1 hypothetical protein H257_08269 [Aphanomyces astaci]|eukprot:XP_009832393.1 hypothetical protein H257_08269 [Aphanomyces astaci]
MRDLLANDTAGHHAYDLENIEIHTFHCAVPPWTIGQFEIVVHLKPVRQRLHSSTAAGQKASDFNKHVYEHWHENKTTTNHGSRSPVAIASRWKKLCPMLTSFNSNIIQALKAIPSGWNEDGVIDNELYAIPDVKLHGIKRTIVLAYWRIVCDAPKWRVEDVSRG